MKLNSHLLVENLDFVNALVSRANSNKDEMRSRMFDSLLRVLNAWSARAWGDTTRQKKSARIRQSMDNTIWRICISTLL
ncbi:hypothetical protein GX51_01258 [Blastomyces parvus]|uniref:Uncharacterized protein n=1 Tax=Blastomyces parvus TaxID=2060905 RepID=A0A2B7XI33_9EURO|nr:hypothetical protein GX51_01258 [Blastomyces parvus]